MLILFSIEQEPTLSGGQKLQQDPCGKRLSFGEVGHEPRFRVVNPCEARGRFHVEGCEVGNLAPNCSVL